MRLRPFVLVIEDDGDTREMYAEVLREEGILVAEASDGQEGFRRAIESLPDLIITDVTMPIMDGWEAIRRLRGDDRTRHIPIIVCSGEERPHASFELSHEAYLGKPCDPEALRLEVRRLLRRGAAA